MQKEASEVFFSVTKLYQSKDANLRRMVYLVIKDVCPGSDEVIIITSSLMKDMNSKTDLYRSNAIRVLCSITDSQLLGQIERYLKQVCTLQWGHTCSGWFTRTELWSRTLALSRCRAQADASQPDIVAAR